MASVEASREAILREIGDPADLTLVRVAGNRGDELIAAGTRALLDQTIYTEIGIDALARARGHTVLLPGSGAFCRPYHEIMPRALAVAELRFERVIVLPSSFDPSEDEVREVLARTRATVFARELESYRRIRALCDARIAHDCAFWFDFSPYRRAGHGTLNAFRTDPEGLAHRLLPAGNDDISATAPDLDRWLTAIAERETVRTDRAHVMIAAALLGKQVEYLPSSYHKVDAIAEYGLADYLVRRLPPPAGRVHAPARNGRPALGRAAPRVAAVILCRSQPELASRAIASLSASTVQVQTIVIDNNSAPDVAATLAAQSAARGDVRVHRSDRNLGCAGGRRLGVEATESELVLFIDDDVELEPGALDYLVAELDEHPQAAAVTATVLMQDGTVHHSGGWQHVAGGVADFDLIGFREQVLSDLPPSGPAGWVPGTAALVRREVLEQFPIDHQMAAYYEDNEWCFRVERARPGSFRRSFEARAVHRYTPKNGAGVDFVSRSRAVELLAGAARFYERHGLLLGALFSHVPELCGADGVRDVVAARVLMELLLAKGTDWTLAEWMNGDLDALLAGSRGLAQAREESLKLQEQIGEQQRAIAAQHETIGAWHETIIEQQLTVAEQHRVIVSLHETIADLQRALEEHGESIAILRERHLTLARIESGGWWRMRQRALPALRLYWSLRGRPEN